MPGTPATSPHYAVPRFSQTDPATFATQLNQVTDQIDAAIAGIPVGGQIGYSGNTDPTDTRFLLAEGRLIDSATYPAFDAIAGTAAPAGAVHKYNGGVNPGSGKVRIPDKRGRVLMGADNMGTTQGAAGRIAVGNKLSGQNGGSELHALTVAEMPSHDHGAATASAASPDHLHSGTTGTENQSLTHNHVLSNGHWIPASTGTFAVVGAGAGGSFVISQANITSILVTESTGLAAHNHNFGTGGADRSLAHSHPITAQGSGTGHSALQPYEVDNVIVRVA